MNFKKIFSSFLLVLSALSLVSCRGVTQMSFLEFKVNDAGVQKEYASEITVKLVPDYEKRTLAVDFDRVFPNRTDKTINPDVKIQGAIIGGENFENFEKVTGFLVKNEVVDAKFDEAKTSFQVSLEDVNKKTYGFKVSWDEADTNYEDLKNFYLDVAELMTQNEPV